MAVLERKEDVIVLPKNYVNTYIGRQYVYVMEDLSLIHISKL